MTIRVIVNGASGKMGRLACATLQAQEEFQLVGGLGREDNLERAIAETQASIVVDLTRADSAFKNAMTIINGGAHPVIGTSGLLPNQVEELQATCANLKLGGIIAPNFSIAAVMMMHFAALAAKFFQNVEIIEAHHPQKFDAPSGTAIKTAEMIAQSRQIPPEETLTQESILGARGGQHEGIPIHSIRLPGILARQQVLFGSQGETLSIVHDSIDRSSFMPGLLLSCQKVTQLNQMIYGLENLLDL
ncbi:Dihydrodipicolinate reductase [Legionella quinlivanii]|uniref:4-hydroxy-tetrahydrodipicolinate reductase n=1 Tax=Legionella quinlivanii TaxID=45073 RepID=A0A0W0XKZ3_9GAMM|nr:4-hydroxy-tetrahydrodipicolinate reductase [Legionella quinlivanii]KTD45123.1 Dihydrodipicolinate reductase [Legionella quinlivanii]SEG49654.1 dihydrodipicolinate reductase [Legionella quinlivanii DSM 21216]STY09731.1 dihydrodipicolinate reductases [Legionella quinlivanii]